MCDFYAKYVIKGTIFISNLMIIHAVGYSLNKEHHIP